MNPVSLLRTPVALASLIALAWLGPSASAQQLEEVVNDPTMLWGSAVPDGWSGSWPEELLTVAERSDFTRTMTTRDLYEFLDAVKWRSEHVHVFDLFTTPLGRVSSAIVLANPRVTSPAEAEASGKPVVYIQGKIHPPEPEGAEASLMVLRDILFGDKGHLLDDQIIIITPIFNVDGTEKLSAQDQGPHVGGKRANTDGADLNRDGVKMETLEVSSLYENLLNTWDPVLFFDSHRMGTGNVAYGIGCSHSTVPAAHPGPRGYVWDTLFPDVIDRVRRDFKIEAFTHALWGEDEWPPRTWDYDETIWAIDAKFLVNAYGLRNRLSVLCETPGAASFERQVFGQYAWISSMLEFTNEHGTEMMEISAAADAETVQDVLDGAESGALRNWVDGEYRSRGQIDILAYRDAFPVAPQAYLPGTSIRDHVLPDGPPEVVHGVEDLTEPVGSRDAWVPRAYLFPASMSFLAEKLETQGVQVEVLDEAVTAEGAEYVVDRMKKIDRGGYDMTVLEGGFFDSSTREFPVGTYRVDMAQPRARAAFYFLEPEARDGMVAWWVFDETLIDLGVAERPIIYPIFKMRREVGGG
ncbi:MAG: M14 family zinc carboxypeptidase [Longimicrobiales bacterium]